MGIETIIAIVLSAAGILISTLSLIFTRARDKRITALENDRRQDEIERKAKEADRERLEKKLSRPHLQTTYFQFDFNKLGYEKEEGFDFDVFFLPYESLDVDESNFTPLYKQIITKHGKGSAAFQDTTAPIYMGQHGRKRPICKYHDVFDKKDEWVSYIVHLKNTGRYMIENYFLLFCFDRRGSLIRAERRSFEILKMTRSCNFRILSERSPILPGDEIKIKISFHKNHIAGSPFSSSFCLYMHTEDGNYWYQGLPSNASKDLTPNAVDSIEYSKYIKGDYQDAMLYNEIYLEKVNKLNRQQQDETEQET